MRKRRRGTTPVHGVTSAAAGATYKGERHRIGITASASSKKESTGSTDPWLGEVTSERMKKEEEPSVLGVAE